MQKSLFRRQALEQQGERLWGELVISQPVSHLLLTLFLTLVITLTLVYLCLNQYSRKQAVQGFLAPDKGLVSVVAPTAGSLANLYIQQGEKVKTGQLLFEVRRERQLEGGEPVSRRLLKQLELQEQALQRHRELEISKIKVQKQGLAKKTELKREEITHLASIVAAQRDLSSLRLQSLSRAESLATGGALATADLEPLRAAYLEQRRAVQETMLQTSRAQAELQDLQAEALTLDTNGRLLLTDSADKQAELEKQKVRMLSDQADLVVAPVSGTVAAVNASTGQDVAPGRAILVLVPENSQLEAVLLIPSRAVAFMAPDQRVNIRFDAFPYQKFGIQHGSIKQVSKSVINQPVTDVEGQSASQSVYKATVRLDSQAVTAYGKAVGLKPGMILSADVELEQRSLLQWLLDPLLSIRGRL